MKGWADGEKEEGAGQCNDSANARRAHEDAMNQMSFDPETILAHCAVCVRAHMCVHVHGDSWCQTRQRSKAQLMRYESTTVVNARTAFNKRVDACV